MQKKKLIAIITLTISLSVVSTQLTYAVTNNDRNIDMVINNETEKHNSNRASVVPFTSRAHEKFGEFQQKFMVSHSEISSYSNNGGKYSRSTLDKAFDGNISTHWETGKPNSSSFINEVTVNFKEVETLDKIGYLVRQDTWTLKGFPLEFEIYSSMSDMGENFELVSKGEYTANKNFIEINFNESQFKRLKFKFVTPKDNWASASEIEFYRPDYVSKEVRNIFTDGTYSQLSEKYMNGEELAKIEDLIMTHPYRDDYREIIDSANELINNLITAQDTVLESLKDGYNQSEIDRLLENLKEAKKALVEIVNYDELEEIIKAAKEVKGYLYTKQSYTNFKKSLDKAEKMLADSTSSILEVSEMITELKSNIESLEMVEGKEDLEKLLDEAYKITDISMIGGTEDREYRWGDFVENRLYAIEVLFDINATNQDVNSVSLFLKISLDDLMIVNYDGLNDAIKDAKDLKEYMYTKESFINIKNTKNTIDKANKMIVDKNSTQVQIEEMIREIKKMLIYLKCLRVKINLKS